jgi:spore coat protein GerQ
MNGNFYSNPTFPGNDIVNNSISDTFIPIADEPMEQSYIENILRHNKGKKVKLYVSFPDSNEWRDKVYDGIIEQAGRDHIIISDPQTGKWYLILMIYLDYVEFEERINYSEKSLFSNIN